MTRSTNALFETLETRSLFDATLPSMPEVPSGQIAPPAMQADFDLSLNNGANNTVRDQRERWIVDLPAAEPEPTVYSGNDLPSA